MTKKYFTLIAEAIYETDFKSPQEKEKFATMVASVLRPTNYSFDTTRFLNAALHDKYYNTKGHKKSQER